MNKHEKKIKLLATVLWGVAFSAQSSGMYDHDTFGWR